MVLYSFFSMWYSILAVGAGGEEAHYSLLHGLFLLNPLKEWIPQPEKQPDLILNTVFVLVIMWALLHLTARKLRRVPESTMQNILEIAIEELTALFGDIVGERGKKYVPFVCSFFFYILFLNLLGLVPGFQSPTADLNTTLGFAMIGVGIVQVIAVREVGFAAYVRHFWGEPAWLGPLMFPLHIIGEIAKVISLSFRLYGNMFGKETVLAVLMSFSPVLLIGHFELPYVPIQLPILAFGVFVAFLQAMIFAILIAIYIAQFLEEHGHDDDHH